MASDGGILMPSGSGGLMRYNEEYKSKFMLSPNHVVILILVVVIGMAVLKLLS
jgi:preprotein translocase subunit Sec61beta